MKYEVTPKLILVTYDERFSQVYVSNALAFLPSSKIEESLNIFTNSVSVNELKTEFLCFKESQEKGLLLYFFAFIKASDSRVRLSSYTNVRELIAKNKIRLLAIQKAKEKINIFDKESLQLYLGEEFTMEEVFDLYRTFVNPNMDKGNFHRMLKNLDILEETGKHVEKVSFRPPMLYRFKNVDTK